MQRRAFMVSSAVFFSRYSAPAMAHSHILAIVGVEPRWNLSRN